MIREIACASLTALVAVTASITAPSAMAAEPSLVMAAAPATALANDPARSLPSLGSDARAPRSDRDYALPILEIAGFDLALNLINRRISGVDDYDSNLSSIRRNLRSSWVVDRDPFETNQLGHPYQGSMYHGFARSAGFGYWTSALFTFAGSAAWEIAGEKTPPSRNDQINTGIGGSFLGEALFRMANLSLENGGPTFWRELGAAAISPATGFNRWAFGDRFKDIYSSHGAAYYSRLHLGFSGTAGNKPGTSTTSLRRNEALADFSMDYGLPGKSDYSYTEPFDYFNFQATASTANAFENVMTRGLLKGREYEAGRDYRGVWGLYGSFDYMAPQSFRVSSTALSLGTTAQWQLTERIALQGTGLAGLGYTAVGTTGSPAEDRNYHSGTSPQALLALRLIFGETASLDFTGREYFVPHAGSDRSGRDNIARIDASLTMRVHKQHGVTIKYLGTRRDARFPDLGDLSQTRGTLGIFYTLLGHDRFGMVDWK